jgi:hypothetical protein
MLLSLALILSLSACQEPDAAMGPSPVAGTLSVATSTTLTASRDGYVTSKHPNRNGGWKDSMDVAQPLRSLVGFDQAAIVSAVGGGTLTNATLRLTIGRTADTWGPTGRTIDVHRLTVHWTEAGETYNCAIDASPSNTTKECSGADEWDMASAAAPPWASPSTAQAMVTTGMTGTVEFDVKADVVAFLGGTPNEGWLLKKTDEDKQGRIVFMTKEGGAAPELVLTVTAPDTMRPPIPNNVDPSDDSLYVLVDPSNPAVEIYSRLARVSFLPSASDAIVAGFFSQFGATIVGGILPTQTYYIQLQTPASSLAALDSLLSNMQSYPGINWVTPVSRKLPPGHVDGRYPTDGPGFSRADWASANQNADTWALNAIRSPLAWGCETGRYTSDRIKVAILEQAFYPNPDILVARRVVADSREFRDSLPQSLVDAWEWHGGAVAGALTATGDNGMGTVGAIWGSDLSVYELTPSSRSTSSALFTFVGQFLTDLISHQPRVLSISSDFELPASAAAERVQLYHSMKSLLDDVSGLLIIKASGDEGQPISANDAKGDLTNVLRSVLVELASTGYADRIVFVGGTARGHTLYSGSAWISGYTEIAAPGENVSVLGLARAGTQFSSAMALGSGTSFSAPLVAGVAAQLLSMNPFLLASQVKQMLIDGAKQPRLDPVTGEVIPASARALQVPGTGDQVYELDAYGSLSLLSAGEDATPICGFPVITSFVNNPETGEVETSVRIARPGFTPQEVFVGNVENVTVAQGGRRIGVDSYDDSRNIDFQTNSWNVGSSITFRGYRQFLEKDTAFTDYSTAPALLTIRGAGTSRGPFDLCTGLPMPVMFPFGPQCDFGPIALTGEWIHAVVDLNNYDMTGCGPTQAFYGSYLVPVAASGARQVLREVSYEPCPLLGSYTIPMGDVVAWRADGAVAWVGQSDFSYSYSPGVPDSLNPFPGIVLTPIAQQTRFEQFRVVSGVPIQGPRTVGGIVSFALGWRADGSTLIAYESNGFDWWGTCRRAVRAGLAPETALSDSGGPVAYCVNAVMEPLAAPRLLQPLAASLRSLRSTPTVPTRAMLDDRNRLRTMRSRGVQRIVLVN